MINDWKDVRGKKVFKKDDETKEINFSLVNKRINIIVETELKQNIKSNKCEPKAKVYGKWIIK